MDPNKPEHLSKLPTSPWDAVVFAPFILFLLSQLGAWIAACAYPGSAAVRLVAQSLYSNGGIALGSILFLAALYRCFARPRRP